jgi:acyl-CoA thioester hydrolase
MQDFSKTFDVRWADIDANRHMRHSAYYDYAAQMRVDILGAVGMSVEILASRGIGPVLFREEAVFKREIGMYDQITVNVKLKKSRQDGSRWTFIHEFVKQDGKLAAVVTVDGAWMDLEARKLTALPNEFLSKISEVPRCQEFEFEEAKAK